LKNLAPVGNTSKPLSGIGGPVADLKGAPSVWSYATADTLATVNTAGYFNAGVAYAGAYNLLNKGDLILVTSGLGSGGTLAQAWATVVDKASGAIDIADGAAIAQTDGD
jgi:hypothetical protein